MHDQEDADPVNGLDWIKILGTVIAVTVIVLVWLLLVKAILWAVNL